MSIVSSVIVADYPEGDYRYVKEVHTNHLGETWAPYYHYYGVVDVNALLAQHALEWESRRAEQEIQEWVQIMNNFGDPWHIAPYVNVVPEFNNWETAASQSMKHFLAIEYMQELLKLEACIINKTSNADLDNLILLAESSYTRANLTGDITIARNTQNVLDDYTITVEV